ncbi:MAG: error-prone DNA polymerase [Gammaproteobacteria bacterium]|nr:error-prone DNA polymerase [Gammaproteobacteria bacterium]
MIALHSNKSDLPDYAELHCISNFSFLRGASHPEELVNRAIELGYHALAITDECSLAGVVRAHVAAKVATKAVARAETKTHRFHLIIGSEFQLDDGLRLVLLATDKTSYGHLSHLITIARRNAGKGKYKLTRQLIETHYPVGCLALWLPEKRLPGQGLFEKQLSEKNLAVKKNADTNTQAGEDIEQYTCQARWLADLFPKKIWIATELLLTGDDQAYLKTLQHLGQTLDIPLCAAGDVHMHVRTRHILQDTLTAIRLATPLAKLGYQLFANSERYLRGRKRLQQLYPLSLLEQTLFIANQCCFSLDELKYEYPNELVPARHTPTTWLKKLTEQGMQQRWPEGVPKKIRQLVSHELALIKELAYEPYFLTVHDIVKFARQQNILCQGRGSAANSAICYCLGITEVDPNRMELLFERFISKERNEPPDIDVDFENARREEVIQYIYNKYGRERAALAATVITYRPRSAIRDVGKALGMSMEQVNCLAKSIQWWDSYELNREQLINNGFAADSPQIKRLHFLVREIVGFPRHLSQHVGGFIINEGLLSHLVPIENAAMPERTVIQWEKDDLESLGLLKIDVLALGMLTAIKKALDLIGDYTHTPMTMDDIPAEDPAVYALIQKADTIGVFQIESRAQMTMLPRLKPKNYYDLVIEIAIVRPGPIQGDMVHPYLARRNGKEPVTYPSEAVKKVLQRTLGIPIFQEQVMQLAMVAAGFTAGEADQLRRAMAAWKRKGGLEKFENKLKQGMKARGYTDSFSQQIFNQIKGFGDYGFPESHSASFALLAYVSSWLKCYHPAAFTCALLNSQPMGFYAPAQLVQDAQRHGVKILPVDINQSEHDCTLAFADKTPDAAVLAPYPALSYGPGIDLTSSPSSPMLRLGFRMIKGLSKTGIETLCKVRQSAPFKDIQDLATRTKLNKNDLESLAAADALKPLSGDRHRAFWHISGIETELPVFGTPHFTEVDVMLRKPKEGEDITADYANTGLTLKRHPLALLRNRLNKQRTRKANELHELPNGIYTKATGLVVDRQRPCTASGVIFITLEDESGYINVVVWPKIAARQPQALLKSKLLAVSGIIQQEEGVLHLIARRLEDLTPWLGNLATKSRDFH